MNKCPYMTTAAGTPVADNQNSQTAGPRGPVLMQDYQLMEKMGADSVAELVKMAYKLGIATLKECCPGPSFHSSRPCRFSSTSALTA